MADHEISRGHGRTGPDAALSVWQTAIVIVYATALWFVAAMTIRFRGPSGLFEGTKGIMLFAVTIPLAIFFNRVAMKLARLTPGSLLRAIAIGSAWAMILDAIALGQFRSLYGPDPAVILPGAAWIFWAVAIGLAHALSVSDRAQDRLKVGDRAPEWSTPNLFGAEVRVPAPDSAITHLQFTRFAGCPVSNLGLRGFIARSGEIRDAGVREVVVFHSDERHFADRLEEFPFDVIADPRKEIFRRYGVESSPLALLNPMGWPRFVRGYLARPSLIPDSSPLGLPADFLIAGDGTILSCHYGAHEGDQWSVDEVLRLAHRRTTANDPLSFGPRSEGEPRLALG